MEFRNFTPFPALAFQALDQHDNLYHVVAARQTLSIGASGELRYCDEQAPLVVADDYFGELNRSSVKQESDLAPFKPSCDVVVVGTGYSPGGVAARRFPAGVRIQTFDQRHTIVDKQLTITGPRFWKKTGSQWELSEPDPTLTLPVRYEYAYGGELRVENVAGQQAAIEKAEDPASVPPVHHSVLETNPVGRGYTESWYLEAEKPEAIPAPQIEDPADPVREFGRAYAAQGFGVISRVWLPRRGLCGTIDEAFRKSDKWLPADFNFAYWNGAHPDLQVPFLRGDEIVELTNLTRQGELRFQLPGHRAYMLIRLESGEIAPVPWNIDTLVIDVEQMKVSVVNRFTISVDPAVRVLEARLVSKDEWAKALESLSAHPEPGELAGVTGGR